MSLLPDPAELYAAADRITRHADALRARAGTLVAAAGHARWWSPAATAFRADVAGVAAQMRQVAGRVDSAADVLRRHARQVEHELALVAAAASAVEHELALVAAAASAVERGAAVVVGGVEQIGEHVLSAVGLG